MKSEPKPVRVHAYFDGQNLYRCTKTAFGYTYPNFDPKKLALRVCLEQAGWVLNAVHFYTGVPRHNDNPFWCHFWHQKLRGLRRQPNVHVFSRTLRYREKTIKLDNGGTLRTTIGQEKGIDVRIAIDIIRHAQKRVFDAALVFSQDQDLSEVAKEIRAISDEQDRWIKIASTFPKGSPAANSRGINGTDWLPFDKSLYDQCLDLRDYRPRNMHR